jgi:hypothetical protein
MKIISLLFKSGFLKIEVIVADAIRVSPIPAPIPPKPAAKPAQIRPKVSIINIYYKNKNLNN